MIAALTEHLKRKIEAFSEANNPENEDDETDAENEKSDAWKV